MTVVSHFDRSWADVHGIEGAAFSNDPQDSGGATKHGVTEAVARAHGYTGPMEALPPERARAIAKTQYWDALNLDAIAGLSPRIAHEIFECGFNCGLGTAGTFLQRCLNVLNRSDLPNGPHWPDLALDGHLGAVTFQYPVHHLRGPGFAPLLGRHTRLV